MSPEPHSNPPEITECPNCGTGLVDGLNAGLCPKCLLATAMNGEEESSGAEYVETIDSGSQNPANSNAKTTSKTANLTAETNEFGDYELIAEIARGGMGVVYKARHQKLGREVALKVILSGQFASSNDVRRFQLEAESAANLDHSGIVSIYEIGEHAGHHYFTMKLVEGGSLAEKMPELRKDIRQFVGLVAEVADSIDYAHRRGILHRDIKPANILLDHDGSALVTDLGLAKHTEADSDLTGTGAIVGTPAYMPPEQASASKEITTSADVFAIGAILYEGLTGRPPFQAESAVATLMQAAKGEIQPPREIEPSADRTLELICLKCLAKDPGDRYASAGLLAQDLRNWLVGEPVSVRPKSLSSALTDLVSNQLRSAIGAMIIGALNGIVIGTPIYGGIARNWLGSDSKFSVASLNESLPNLAVSDSWWLHPPDWISSSGFFVGVLLSVFTGLIIQWIVRPNDTKQAIAIGLVAGLLMTLVQFGMYGISAVWQGYALQNADQVHLLAQAGVGSEQEKRKAIKKIYQNYPDLKNTSVENRGELLGKAVSVQIMLGIPAIYIACLLVCLTFSIVCCVGGTVHAHRIQTTTAHWIPSVALYLEVMLLLTVGMIFAVLIIFYQFGMITNNGEYVRMPMELPLALLTCCAMTIPGWMLSRWYYRWGTYLLCPVLYFVITMVSSS